MQKNDRVALIIGGVIVAGILGAYYTDVLTEQKLLYSALTSAILGGGYLVYRDKHLLKNWKTQVGLDQNPLQNALTEKEAREKVQEWARTYAKGNMKFHFANAESDSVKLYRGEDDVELLRAYSTSFTGSDRAKIVFVECVKHRDVVGHATVKYRDQLTNPFEYSQYYQSYIREKKIDAYRDSYRGRRRKPRKPTESGDSE